MLNFALGPVMMNELVQKIGAEQIPYFRTQEFSNVILENEKLIKDFAGAGEGCRAIFITGSGTAAMEAAIANFFDEKDKLLIINGGSFGQRFVDLCSLYKIAYEEIRLSPCQGLTKEKLFSCYASDFTGLLVNVHETSTGVYYDLEMIKEFCAKNSLFLVVDAISSFLADPFDMDSLKVDIMITGSQKALACAPGVSIIVLSERAQEKIRKVPTKCMYLDIKNALKNADRGQTPFTPAVGILRQINGRLNEIKEAGGVQAEIERVRKLAIDFRARIKELPLVIASQSMSNAATPLHPLNGSAYDIFTILKEQYQIWVCPNGGKLADQIFRIGHIGNLTVDDNSLLIEAFNDMHSRGLL